MAPFTEESPNSNEHCLVSLSSRNPPIQSGEDYCPCLMNLETEPGLLFVMLSLSSGHPPCRLGEETSATYCVIKTNSRGAWWTQETWWDRGAPGVYQGRNEKARSRVATVPTQPTCLTHPSCPGH